MCGIAGFVTSNNSINSTDTLIKMINSIEHRGPDDSGTFETKSKNSEYSVALGHRRLAIIDLKSGHQPIFNEDGTKVIVYNGEVYNFKEITEELKSKGHFFKTNSDTETILHAYEEFGEYCVEKFRGMFAFAIWDKNEDKLLLARDRFGKKPLFYYTTNKSIVFGSEIKTILEYLNNEYEINYQSIYTYLLYRYVPGPSTLFKGIFKLDPGHIAIWKDGKFCQEAYYHPPDKFRLTRFNDCDNPVHEFLKKFDEAVKIRMVSDVPFGAFLSGGLDSSSIVALMSRYSSYPIKTFVVGFEEENYSEESYAEIVSKQFKTDNHTLIISAKKMMDNLPDIIKYRDAPISETADLPLYLLSKFASKTVKMVLTGEGSDEVLAGYPKHVYERYSRFYNLTPLFIRKKLIEAAVRNLPYKYRRIKIALAALGTHNYYERLPRWFGALTQKEISDLLILKPKEICHENGIQFQTDEKNSLLRKILYYDQTSWLPDNLLERGDRMTMAASLEGRMPFMDHKLVEFVSSLPDKYRINRGVTKWLLRESMKDILPKTVLKRKKVGFRLPVNEWFQKSMKDFLYDNLTSSSSKTKDYYNIDIVKRMLNEHITGKKNHEKLLWCLLNLELWHKVYV